MRARDVIPLYIYIVSMSADKLSKSKAKRDIPADPHPSSSVRPSQVGCARVQELPFPVSWIWIVASAVSLWTGEASEKRRRMRTELVGRVFGARESAVGASETTV
jgi:hypothetical protein